MIYEYKVKKIMNSAKILIDIRYMIRGKCLKFISYKVNRNRIDYNTYLTQKRVKKRIEVILKVY